MKNSPTITHKSQAPEAETHLNSQADFDMWASRLRNGEDAAYRDLLQRYAKRLRALAAVHISPQLRTKYDADDVLQSVLRNFFTSLKSGTAELNSSRAMRGLLALMVKRKCAQYAENYATAKRDIQREESSEIVERYLEYPSREPTPDAVVLLADSLAHWLERFDDQDRQIVEGILQGEASAAIAERLGTSQRTIQRTVRRICLRLGLDVSGGQSS